LNALVSDVHEIKRQASGEWALVTRVAQRLALGGGERDWLVARYRGVSPREYRQDVVYIAPDRRWSIVALTWGPGAQTPIHDHAGWCAVGVYEGVEHETCYRLAGDADRRYLVEAGSRSLEPGLGVAMAPDGTDIHRVGNYSREVTLSIHVYGMDIERVGTSIKSRFDRLPVRE
jgi:predicted metal-dependent enzyme (double-stranded beta helix superfamily)